MPQSYVTNQEEPALGLECDKIRFARLHDEWRVLYEAEAQRIRAALGNLVVGIEHFGSTAIPGINAKPIIDILTAVANIERGPDCIPLLTAIGYEYRPTVGIPGDYTFARGPIRVTHLVHVVAIDSVNWCGNLKFRDTLRANPTLAQEYEALKQQLADDYQDRVTYTVGKTEFVLRVSSTYGDVDPGDD